MGKEAAATVELNDIYAELTKQDARVYVYPIGFARAATIECDGRYGVFLDMAATDTLAGLKEALAHECGHCATGATHRTDSPYDLIEKHEYKANRWAYEHFLPFKALQSAMAGGCTQSWQLAEAFAMPQHFVEGAIDYYTHARGKKFTNTTESLDNRHVG